MRPDAKTWVLILLLVAFFGLFLFYPIANIFRSALWESTGPTLHYLTNALARGSIRAGFANAFALACLTTLAASVLAVPLAYLGARTAFPGKGLLSAAVLVPMILPPFVGAIGLKQVMGPMGVLNAALVGLGLVDRADVVDWFRVYPLVGVVALQALHLYPILYLNVVAGLANVDPSVEDAARSVGAGPWRVFWRVTFPLALPATFAGGVLVFIWALTDLGTPLMFNFREVTAVQIFDRVSEPSSPEAGALVVLMLALVVVLYGGARALFGRKAFGQMAVATRAAEPARLGRRGTLLAWLLFGGVTLLAVVPHLSVILYSLKTRWQFTVLPEGLTLAHHAEALAHPWTLPSIRNSCLYSLGATAVCLVLAVWIGYVLVRKRFVGRGLLDAMVMLPLALPGLVLAFGYLNAYADWGDRLVAAGLWSRNYLYPQDNPVGLLVVAYAVRRLPLAVRSVVAGFQQTSPALEEAARSVGAGPARTLWRITVPLILANLAAGAILVFSMSMLEVSDSLILAQDDAFNPVTRTIYRIYSSEYAVAGDAVASALGVWAMVFLAATLIGATALMGKRLGAIFRA
ncbi:MAG: iron ABC transporter permease [Phycisphaerae bacterium]|nr:iron ABC transporter permease [Phycisphaerae bacterium]